MFNLYVTAMDEAGLKMLKEATDSEGFIADPIAVRAAVLAALTAQIPSFQYAAYEQAVFWWLWASLELGPLSSLYPKYLVHAALLAQDDVKKFAHAVQLSGRWSSHSVEEHWPPDAAPVVKKTVMYILSMSENNIDEFEADLLNEAFPLANQELSNARRQLPRWTGGEIQGRAGLAPVRRTQPRQSPGRQFVSVLRDSDVPGAGQAPAGCDRSVEGLAW